MPSFITIDAFRLRWFSKPTLPNSPSSLNSNSNSEHQPLHHHVRIRFTPPRHSADPPPPHKQHRHIEKSSLPPLSSMEFTNQLLNEKSSPRHLPQQLDITPHISSTTKPSIIRRVTSKLHITVPSPFSSSLPQLSPTSQPRTPPPPPPPPLNSFVSRENREAALRERGLLPPCKDLSEQEREADDRLGLTPIPVTDNDHDGCSAASKIKQEWLSTNRCSSETHPSDSSCLFYPTQLHNFNHLAIGVAPISPSFFSAFESPTKNSIWDSDSTHPDLLTEIPFVARSSISSSLPPLSPSSHLQVLREEQATDHIPPTPPPTQPQLHSQPPIIVATPVENSFSTADLVDSPGYCTFPVQQLFPPSSSSRPNSLSSDISYSLPVPPSRRRTADSNDRKLSSVGTPLSKFSTKSFTNPRRSVMGNVRYSGSSAALSTSSSQLSSPRASVRPTMHNYGSILLEASNIEDAESRRLSEIAFLD